jgi:hypothetical protein
VVERLLLERAWIARNLWADARTRPAEAAFVVVASAAAIALLIGVLATQRGAIEPLLADSRAPIVAAALGAIHGASALIARRRTLARSWWQTHPIPAAALLLEVGALRGVEGLLVLLMVSLAGITLSLQVLVLAAVGIAVGTLFALKLGGVTSAAADDRSVAPPPPHALNWTRALALPYAPATQWAPARFGVNAQVAIGVALALLPELARGLKLLLMVGLLLVAFGLLRAWWLALEEIAHWHQRLRAWPYSRGAFLRSFSLRPALLVIGAMGVLAIGPIAFSTPWAVLGLGALAVALAAGLSLGGAFAWRDDLARLRIKLGALGVGAALVIVAGGPFGVVILLALSLKLWRDGARR